MMMMTSTSTIIFIFSSKEGWPSRSCDTIFATRPYIKSSCFYLYGWLLWLSSTHTRKKHMIPGSRETHKTQSISLVCAVLIDRSAAYICRNIAKLFFLIFVTPENSQAHLYHWLYTFVSALFCQFLCPTLAATALLVFMFYCFYNLQEANRPLVGLLIIISCLSGAVVLRSWM